MIIVETPFGEHKVLSRTPTGVKTPGQHGHSDVKQQSRRASSIDAWKFFSIPLQAFRKGSRPQAQQPSEEYPSHEKGSKPVIEHRGHKSLLKQDDTGSTLAKASVALETLKKARKPKVRSWKIKSASSTSSSDKLDSGHSGSKGVSSTFNIISNNSSDFPASTTSSILAIQRGSTPQNSPTELATYRIRRTRSAETEEFLKIDISTRGHTSYLPSEARRIHTPPLPEDHNDRQSRGFFFDYRKPEANAPQSPRSSFTTSQEERSRDKHNLKLPLKNQFTQRVATQVVTPLLSLHPSSITGEKLPNSPSRAKTGEWYDAHLADIDRPSPENDLFGTLGGQSSLQSVRECQSSIADLRRRQLEAQLDYDIPEHLPSSPLCPRHPKYWRVVKQKGSQFRGCWMHGYGEYSIVPGLANAGAIIAGPTIRVTSETAD